MRQALPWITQVQLDSEKRAAYLAHMAAHPGDYAGGYAAERAVPFHRIETAVIFDPDQLCQLVADRAAASKTGRSRVLNGLIQARRLHELGPDDRPVGR